MVLFRQRCQYAVMLGLLLLALVVLPACNGDSADAEETSTATTAAETPTGVSDSSPAHQETQTPLANDAAETAIAQQGETPEAADETTASPGNSGTGSLPGLEGYIDNRSGPVEVLQSLYSAVNLKQYARAYGYWEASDQLPRFEEFAGGYANTETVELTTGEVTSDVGAGQLYFAVPVTLDVTTTDGGSQIFAGCYVLHLARPEMQIEPPYTPMSIASADIREVAGDEEAAAVMAEGCG